MVEPPVSTDALHRKLGDMNMAEMDVKVAEPKLPVPIQLAPSVGLPGSGSGGNGQGASLPSPPPLLSGGGNGTGQTAVGQIIALGLNPTAPTGPIEVPKGSRYGQFAATPEGKPGAPGTPDIKGGGTATGGGGNGTGTSGPGSGGNGAGPPGISISPGPTQPGTGVVVAGNPVPGAANPNTETTPKPVLATSIPTRPADVARKQPASSVTEPAKIEDKVFAGKRYYSMTLNMPNLTSAGGSWIIRFAELNENGNKGNVTAPVATLKVDPAYPAEALRDRIEGTVTLYAVIHKDGSVGEVRVLNGIDQRLDENACQALRRWHFRPGTRNGDAVDLEAVVQIPFRARKLPF